MKPNSKKEKKKKENVDVQSVDELSIFDLLSSLCFYVLPYAICEDEMRGGKSDIYWKTVRLAHFLHATRKGKYFT